MRDKVFLLAAIVMMMAESFAFQPVPSESAKALRVTRGKPFSSGAVFVNGKYIEPPYVVERWGTGIRINKIPVTGQIVDWNEFLRTQPNVRTEKKDPAPPSAQSAPVQSVAADSAAAATSSLDDLFDDEAKPKASVTTGNVSAASAPVKSVVTYALDGEFRPNDDSKALLNRVNAARTEIDRALRSGGFICFGDSYSQVQGDRRAFLEMLEAIPEAQQRSSDEQAFYSRVRAAKLVYLNEVLCQDLYRNRMDYLKLKERRKRIKSTQKWDRILEEASDPLF